MQRSKTNACRRTVALTGQRFARFGLAALAVLLLSFMSSWSAAERNLLGGSTPEFVELARRMEHSLPEEKAEFARVALDEMAFAFLEEAQRAREEPPDPKKPRNEEKDPKKWAASTDAYANQLMELSESIVFGATVEVRVAQEGTVILLINGHNVIVSGPRIDKPEILEQRIRDRVCLDASCLQLASGSPAPASERRIGGRWSHEHTGAPVFSASNGLNFLFEDNRNLAGKERACLAVAQELESVIGSLKDMLWRQAPIDWDSIVIVNDPAAATQKLLVNRNGDAAHLPLPQLARTPYVLQSALPWVRSQAEGRYREHYVQLPPNIFD